MHKVEQARRMAELSVKELAELSGISKTSIRKIESEGRKDGCKTRKDVAKAIADALKVPMITLFEWAELSEVGRPAKTGSPIVNIASKRRTSLRCSEPGCNMEAATLLSASGPDAISECHGALLVS